MTFLNDACGSRKILHALFRRPVVLRDNSYVSKANSMYLDNQNKKSSGAFHVTFRLCSHDA